MNTETLKRRAAARKARKAESIKQTKAEIAELADMIRGFIELEDEDLNALQVLKARMQDAWFALEDCNGR